MTAVVLSPNDTAGEREVAAAAALNPDLVRGARKQACLTTLRWDAASR
jgi:hypothetical protein